MSTMSPGPWRACPSLKDVGTITLLDANGGWIGKIGPGPNKEKDVKAILSLHGMAQEIISLKAKIDKLETELAHARFREDMGH